MRRRPPLLYDLVPTELEEGDRWLELSLRNAGTDRLTSLDVRLNSRDPYSLRIPGPGQQLKALDPGAERLLPFEVSIKASGRLYVSVDGWRIQAPLNERPFHWESGDFFISASRNPADLVTLFALTEPYPSRGEEIHCEATLRGVAGGRGLTLEFIADTPAGHSETLEVVRTGALRPGEEARFTTTIRPREIGLYAIHAYLFEDGVRIGHEIEYIHVMEE